MLESRRLKLRLLERGDLSDIVKWRNSDVAYNAFFTHILLNDEMQEKWYEKQLFDQSQLNFAIIHKETGIFIGMISLYEIDNIGRRAEWGRLIIGNKKMLRGGYGQEAIEIVLEYAFDYLGMHRVQCTALATNTKVVKLYDRIGFRREGVWRDFVYKGGRFIDVMLFSILNDEYREKQEERQ